MRENAKLFPRGTFFAGPFRVLSYESMIQEASPVKIAIGTRESQYASLQNYAS